MNTRYKQSIDSRELTVGVIGLGYVGLPLVFAFVDQGFPTIGFDIDQTKVDMLHAGRTYIKHLTDSRVAELRDSGKFDATTDFARARDADALLLCVPTPLTPHREPDMTYVVDTAQRIAPHLRQEHLVILESTTYPGTTDEVLKPIFEQNGLKCGSDFFLAYSPEREDPGNKTHTTSEIPKVAGANDPLALERACCLYEQIVPQVVPVSSTRTAEAVKLTENIFRCVNIALVNELKMVYAKMGIDVWEVIEAAKTKPFGFMPFYPGPGLGGHCIPIDPFYLTWKAREFGSSTRFIELAGEINVSMPEYVVHELASALNDMGKPIKGSSILVMGMSYKKDVDDIRESPSMTLIEILAERGAKVDYHDPHVPIMKPTRRFAALAHMKSVDLTPENVSKYDAVLISTDHSSINYGELVANAQLVVDTRNATKGVRENRDRIVKA
jgi:UDP-N-acetyl-D-glucosamine dehydrogenase